MSRIRNLANIFSGNTDSATDAEVTSAISTHASNSTNRHYKVGTTANRPESPAVGDLYFDTTLDRMISYSSSGWTIHGYSRVPGQPTALSGLSGNNSVSLTWSAPLIDGGESIINYVVQYSSNSGSTWNTFSSAQSNSTSKTVTGLVNGTSYIFKVAAVNIVGTGEYSSNSSPISATDPIKATGGTTVSSNGYTYHTFTSSGTFTPISSLTAEVLVVAGGGGSGTEAGAGGGAGGLLGFTSQSLSATGYTVTVGAGGSGAPNAASSGSTGNDSRFGALTLVKGGGGGGGNGASGGAGGSGGGGSRTGTGGAATSGQGFSGGNGGGGNQNGGGGGAGAAGTSGVSGVSTGPGGNGSNSYSVWGQATGTGENVNSTYWFAGGGGATIANGGNGGGGGANKVGANNAIKYTGVANTGGGGGSSGDNIGRAGGSGIVIVRYAI